MINSYKYQVLSPQRDKSKPYYDTNKNLHFKTDKYYTYYVEAITYINDCKTYVLLLGTTKFDINCKPCNKNLYGNIKIKPDKELREYIEKELQYRTNIEVTYKESEDDYDVFIVE